MQEQKKAHAYIILVVTGGGGESGGMRDSWRRMCARQQVWWIQVATRGCGECVWMGKDVCGERARTGVESCIKRKMWLSAVDR